MSFRILITGLTLAAGIIAAIGALEIFGDGRTWLGIVMLATGVVVSGIGVATWRWSGQAEPVKGIHY